MVQLGVGAAACDAEDLVQEAMLRLCHWIEQRKIAPIDTEDELERAFRHKLHQAVLDERDRQHAGKRLRRDAPHDMEASTIVYAGAGLDRVDPQSRPADEQAIACEELEAILERLDRYDHSLALREIACRKAEWQTHEQIADALCLPLSTIDHRVQLIKAILQGRAKKRHC
jgi:DNA-directed RNA polymerase specialized sigma24 family protein